MPLAALALACAVGAVALGSQAEAEGARLCRAAAVCEPGERDGCQQQEEVTVVRRYHTTGGRSRAPMVTVRRSDGKMIDLANRGDDGLYEALVPGAEVVAEYWGGKPVALKDGERRTMLTQHNPAWNAENHLKGVFLLGTFALLFGLFAFLGAGFRESRRPGL